MSSLKAKKSYFARRVQSHWLGRESAFVFASQGKHARSSKCTQIVQGRVVSGVIYLTEEVAPFKSKLRFKYLDRIDYLEGLPVANLSPEHSKQHGYFERKVTETVDNEEVTKRVRVFVNGGPDPSIPPLRLPQHFTEVLSVHRDFSIFDSNKGGYCKNVFTLCDRASMISKMGNRNDLTPVTAAYQAALLGAPRQSEEELDSRVHRRLVYEDGNNRYPTVGRTTYQGKRGTGVNYLSDEHVTPTQGGHIKAHLNQVSKCVREHLDPCTSLSLTLLNNLLNLSGTELRQSKSLPQQKGEKKTERTVKCQTVLPSLAAASCSYASIHDDRDYNVSIISIVSPSRVVSDSAILVYMCFPGTGIAVALRNGDTIIFNPRELHCMSSRVDSNVDVICIAQYMQTSFVGGNNNKQNLSVVRNKSMLKY